jgi:hypothetical protein
LTLARAERRERTAKEKAYRRRRCATRCLQRRFMTRGIGMMQVDNGWGGALTWINDQASASDLL